jgi:hypothetical protein
VPILFGTYNSSTATTAEVELSQSLQTAFANFAKDPVDVSPAPNWPRYEPGFLGIARNPTLAKIAYQENVDPDDFIKPVQPISTVSSRNDFAKFTCLLQNGSFIKQDGPCFLWDHFLDYRPSASAGAYSRGTSMVDNQIGAQDNSSPILSLRVQVSG